MKTVKVKYKGLTYYIDDINGRTSEVRRYGTFGICEFRQRIAWNSRVRIPKVTRAG